MTWFDDEFDDSSFLDYILNFNDNSQQPQTKPDATKNTQDNNTVIHKEDQVTIPDKKIQENQDYVDFLMNYNDNNQLDIQENSQSRKEPNDIQNNIGHVNSSDIGNDVEADEDTIPDYILQQLEEEEHDGPEIICISSDDETDYENEQEDQDDQTEKENLPATETDYIDLLSSDEETDDDDVEFLYEIPGTKRRSRASVPKRSKNLRSRLVASIPKVGRSRKVKVSDGVPFRNGMDPNVYCCQCRVKLVGTESQNPLTQRIFVPSINKYRCLGCYRLLEIPNSKDEERDMINWLVCGKLSKYDKPPRYSPRDVWGRIKVRRAAMLKRCYNHRCDHSLLVTEHQLFDMCYKYKNKCAITGFITYWHDYKRSRIPFWALTFDHITPLYDCKQFREAWSVSNIQIMCLALNQVKGHYSDNEVKRWYAGFIRATVIEL